MKKIILVATLLIVGILFIFGTISAANHQRILDDTSALIRPYSEELFLIGSQLQVEENIAVEFEIEEGLWLSGSVLTFDVEIPKTGTYAILINYLSAGAYFEQNQIDIYVNGTRTPETTNVILDSRYIFTSHEIRLNSRGTQIYPEQQRQRIYQSTLLTTGLEVPGTEILVLELETGTHTLEFSKNLGAVYLGGLSLTTHEQLQSYEQYLMNTSGADREAVDEIIILEAQHFYYKNSRSIGLRHRSGTTVSPYRPEEIILNVINGNTFSRNSHRIAYFVEITTPGFYYIGVRGSTLGKIHMPVFIDIEINSRIPFEEFSSMGLDYSSSNRNFLFDAYPIFLDAGVHEIAFVINNQIYGEIASRIAVIAREVNQFGLELQRLTGNNQDPNREWMIEEFLPEIVTDLTRWRNSLAGILSELESFTNGRSNEEISHVGITIAHLEQLINEPNEAPFRMSLINTGANSAFQRLQSAVLTLNEQPLELDQILIVGTGANQNQLPRDVGNFALATRDMFRHALTVNSHTNHLPNDGETFEVWIRRPQQHFDIATNLIESYFMETTGMNVNISLMSDQTIVALANMAGRQPDVVIGIDAWYVNDLALRGSLANLRQFPDAQQVIENAIPGALIQMVIDDQLFGLPDQQDFHVMYFRRDIFDAFGFEVPQTWDEILLLLPQLQRNGMNFYTPLASGHSLKSWVATMPFYAKFDADIYALDGQTTLINSPEGVEAMQFMTDLFMVYGMPQQVGSFFNDFRSGQLPIGVETFSMYALLRAGAPEISGLWEIVPVPGRMNEDGEIMHFSTGGSSAVVIFERSNLQNEAWEFVSWWLSTENQVRYMNTLQNAYGEEFLWSSGNRHALLQMPIPQADLDAIERQIEWILEAPRIPGGYITEREVSNAFTSVVYGGANVRMAINEAAMIGNREIARKMEEFGYINAQGEILRPFIVPTIYQIKGWGNNYD